MPVRPSPPSRCDGTGEAVDTDDLDTAAGLSRFATSGPGINGVLKMRAEDFRVEEVGRTPSLDPRGRFTVIRVTLRDWETNRFVNRLASSLKISRNRIWFSGTKDKKAITTQLMVVDAQKAAIQDVEIADVEIEIIGRTHQKVGMGAHHANRFTIVVRGCADDDGSPLDARTAMSRVVAIKEAMEVSLGEGIFPNWVGSQRFGSLRPVTPIVGRHVIESNFEQAVSIYIGMPGLFEDEASSHFREMWRENGDAAACLEIAPNHLGYERAMLQSYVDHPDNHVKAFLTLPRNLQIMMVHSVQSMAFNHVLAARLDAGLPLAEPVLGDIVTPLSAEGKIDVGKVAMVDDTNLARCIRNCRFSRLAVTGPLPGATSKVATHAPGDIESKILKEHNLDGLTWQVEKIGRLSSNGSRRAFASRFEGFSIEDAPILDAEVLDSRWENGPRTGEVWHPEGACLRFRFSLPPGTYATVLMREFMQAKASQY